MQKDNLHIGTDARNKLIAGINKVADAVGATMGTGGSNAILEAIEAPGHLMTNDGYSIANSIILADPIEDMGRKILLESINRANKASGDGSSTTCVLTAAIIREGMKALMPKYIKTTVEGGNEFTTPPSAMEIKRSLEACLPHIEAYIKSQTRQIEPNQVGQVATISAEDPEIGKTIQTIYEEIGRTGIIHWDVSKTATDSYTIGTGLTIDWAGLYSPYMADASEAGQGTGQVRLKKPLILLTKQKIASAADFNEIGQALYNKDIRDVVVFCDDVDPLVSMDLIKTRMVRGFRFILVKMPVLWKNEWFEDLALATGATIIDPAAGLSLKNCEIFHLGTVENITITKDTTFIDGIKDLSEHIAKLQASTEEEEQLRATRLNVKTARYYVGALSESALSYRRLKVEDAISASYHALNGGVVAGGGVALAWATSLPETIGGEILSQALKAPMNQIVSNAGGEKDPIVQIPLEKAHEYGFDTRTLKQVNMFDAGIVDPAVIVLNAVKNAISVAATVLTANAVVTLPRQESMPMQPHGDMPR